MLGGLFRDFGWISSFFFLLSSSIFSFPFFFFFGACSVSTFADAIEWERRVRGGGFLGKQK